MAHVWKSSSAAWSVANPEDLQVIQDVLFGWQEFIVPGLLNNYQVVDMSFLDLSSAFGQSGTLAPNGALPLTGGNVSAATSPNVSLLVHKTTAALRNQRSGRMYVTALSEADVDENGLVSAPLQAGMDVRFANWLAAVDQTLPGSQYELHVPHIQIPPGPPPIPPTTVIGSSSEILSFTTDPLAATQRRRMRA